MKGRRSECRCREHAPDMDETKEHILAAGKEIMMAAQGALRFCREYAEATASPSTRMQLVSFFGKAIAVADELSRGLVSASSVTRKARSMAAPFFDAVGNEMKAEERMERAHRKTAKPQRNAPRRKSASAVKRKPARRGR